MTEDTCHADLDHAVLVSGYGTTEEGHDYWLVKNTWSSLWGDKGYIKIARGPKDCGIKTQPMYVDLKLEWGLATADFHTRKQSQKNISLSMLGEKERKV